MDYDQLAAKLHILLPHLDERQRRLYLASEARALGKGGIDIVAKAARCSPATIYRGLKDLDSGEVLPRTRRSGAGRKRVESEDDSLKRALEQLVAATTRGDPMSPLQWTCLSTRNLVAALKKEGYEISPPTVARLLKEMGYSLQANQKTKEGGDHVDRDAQFQHINQRILDHQQQGNPVISVDCKKKELVGDFKNAGREWGEKGEPVKVRVHDWPIPGVGKALPYGVYDITRNEGFVNVGCDHETSAFAVETIRRWFFTVGQQSYPNARALVIVCDGGGSNGYRRRQWKLELSKLATEFGIPIHVHHLPPGTSKWNKIEHRLFSHITMNWRGRPLESHEVVVNLIAATTTHKGLKVQAVLDTGKYPTKVKIPDDVMAQLPIEREEFHGEWNYTVHPGSRSA